MKTRSRPELRSVSPNITIFGGWVIAILMSGCVEAPGQAADDLSTDLSELGLESCAPPTSMDASISANGNFAEVTYLGRDESGTVSDEVIDQGGVKAGSVPLAVGG